MGQKMKEKELKLTFLYWSAFTASMLQNSVVVIIIANIVLFYFLSGGYDF